MADTVPNPASVRITHPFANWYVTGPVLIARGNYSPPTATVRVDVRYAPGETEEGTVVYTSTDEWEAVFFDGDPIPAGFRVSIIATAEDGDHCCEDSCSVNIDSSRAPAPARAAQGKQKARRKK